MDPESVVTNTLNEKENHPLISYHLYLFHFQTYLVDFYAHDPLSANAASEHVGFCYVLQNNLTQNQGAATVPITSPRHQAIGQLRGMNIIEPAFD